MSNTSCDRRTILAGIGSVTGSVALSGCSGRIDGLLGRGGSDEVKLWHHLATDPPEGSDGPSQTKTLTEQINRYLETTEANVALERIGSDRTEYQRRVVTQLPNGSGPHSFSWVHRPMGTYQGRTLLYETPADDGDRLDLGYDVQDTYLDVAVAASQFRPFRKRGTERDESPRRYGLPYGATTVTLVYNPDHVDTPPQTVSEWLDSMDRIQEGDDVDYGLVCPGAPFYVSPWARAFGGEYYVDYDEATGSGEIRFASDETVEGVSYFRDEIWPYTPEKPVYDEQYKQFKKGNAAYAIATPSEFARLDETDDVTEVRATTLPDFETDDATLSPYVDVYLWYFSRLLRKRAEKRAVTAELLEWLTTTDSVVATNATEHGIVPVTESLPAGVEDDSTMRAYRESATAGAPSPSHPDMKNGWTILQDAFRTILKNDVDVREELESARSELEETLDKKD
jgi:arabinogalactan oligomer/maltooligosaccharide transport system substrate-binding protein